MTKITYQISKQALDSFNTTPSQYKLTADIYMRRMEKLCNLAILTGYISINITLTYSTPYSFTSDMIIKSIHDPFRTVGRGAMADTGAVARESRLQI